MKPLVGVIMGSKSDWDIMANTVKTLDQLGIACEVAIISAHRTPDRLSEWAGTAEERGLEVIIAAAGGAAHLAGVAAAKTVIPVLGVPMESKSLHGMDSLLSMVQMPAGVPVAVLAIGKPGAINAALYAAAMLGARHPAIREAYRTYRSAQTESGLRQSDPRIAE